MKLKESHVNQLKVRENRYLKSYILSSKNKMHKTNQLNLALELLLEPDLNLLSRRGSLLIKCLNRFKSILNLYNQSAMFIKNLKNKNHKPSLNS